MNAWLTNNSAPTFVVGGHNRAKVPEIAARPLAHNKI